MQFRHQAVEVLARAMADVLKPPQPMLPSQWAVANLVVPDGPKAGEPWSLELTPYIREPLDMLGPESPVNEIAVRKSAQTGFTTLLIAAVGHTIDRDPCRMMVIQPTDAALSDFNRDKLQPAIDSSKALAAKVAAQTSRSATGSTTYSKRYPGGSLTLAIATSAADLRSKTIKKLLRDEIDQYPDDLDGQGDPLEISDGRLMSFLAQGDWKKADISTPTIKGGSKIDRRFEQGDQRFWRFPCPHCGEEFGFEWGSNFLFSREFPHKAHYSAPCCGSIIEAHEKNSLVRRGRWVATIEEPGRFPSYHFDALSSPFVPWDEVAKAFVAAGDDESKIKTFWNLWLGLAYEIRGDAPDHVRLMERREDHPPRGHVPGDGLMLIAAADVQMRGIWYLVKAITADRRSYVVEALYLDGDTSSPDGESFQLLRRELDREFPDAFGNLRRIDSLGVDSGYRSHVVYAWSRANQRLHPHTGRDVVLCLKGRDGWGLPAIGTPSLVDITLAGKKIKKGAKLWAVGTWPLKGAFYEDLRREGRKAGREKDPPGYCHFGAWLDENFFRQLTAEYLADERFRGQTRRVWKIRGSEKDNHFLDCEVYVRALAEYLGLSRMTSDDWAKLAERHGLSITAAPLFAASPDHEPASAPALAPPPEAAPAPPPVAKPPAPPRANGWLGSRPGWLNRNR